MRERIDPERGDWAGEPQVPDVEGGLSAGQGKAHLTLGQQQLDALLAVLTRVREESRARAVLLIDGKGMLLGEVGETSALDITRMGPLAASSVAATSSLAALVGEREFTVLFHQAEDDSIQLTLVEDGVILAVFFGREAPWGLVRLRSRKASREIQDILRHAGAQRQEPSWLLDPPGEITAQDIEEFFTF